MTRRVEKVMGYLLLAPALLPLLYVNGFLYPYVAPKTFIFRALGCIVLAALLFLIGSGRALYWERLKRPVTWIPAALIVIAYVTSLFGVDFYHSFWSIYDRGDGLLTLTVCGAFFYAIILFADAAFLRTLARLSLWVGGLIALYALLQWVQSSTGLNIPLIEEPRGRYGSTFGNAAFMAAFLGMTLFLSIAIVREYVGKWSAFAWASVLLQLFAIILSATRGTLLALAGAGALAAAYVAWRGEGRARKYARGACVGVLIVAGLFFVFRTQLAQVPIEPIRRIASISLADATVSSRLFVWQNMITVALEKPLLGVGAEHVDILFNRFYDPGEIIEEWFDRSHNAFLDYFVQYGVLGLLLYLALIITLLFRGYQLMRERDPFGTALVLVGITYALQNFFVFDTALSLWLLCALLAAGYAYDTKSRQRAFALPRLHSAVAMGIALLFLVAVIPASVQPLRANRLLADAYIYHVADPARTIASLEKGLSLGTYADLEYGYQVYNMYVDEQLPMLTGEARIKVHRFAVEVLKKNFERYSYDARTAVYYAHVLESVPPEVAIDEAELRRVVERAKALSPKRMQPWFIEANLDLRPADRMPPGPERTARYRHGIALLEDYAALVPNYADPRYILAGLYLAIDDRANAKRWADEALPLYRHNAMIAQRAVRYYIAVEDWPNAARFMQDIANSSPEDYPLQYDLAKVKWLSGDKGGAREIVERIKVEAPGLFETDPNFVKEYTAVK